METWPNIGSRWFISILQRRLFSVQGTPRLPTENEWCEAAYKDVKNPPPPFFNDNAYPYPMGSKQFEPNCLENCGIRSLTKNTKKLTKDWGHVANQITFKVVDTLYDMEENVWE